MTDTPWTDNRAKTGTCDGWECCRELERNIRLFAAGLCWAHKKWKDQPFIKPLFEVADEKEAGQ